MTSPEFEKFLAWSAQTRREFPAAVPMCETRISKALTELQPRLEVPEVIPKVHRCHLARDFCALRALPEGSDKRALVCEGVRHGLSLWFRALAERREPVAFPRDVYPVYWELAQTAEVEAFGFDTFPEADLATFFARCTERKVRHAVLPFPWKLHGRAWSPGEVEAALAWLGGDPTRRLALDGVYGFAAKASASLLQLLGTGQVLLFDSLSKGFLHAQVFGVALVPPSDFEALAPRFRSASPWPEKLWRAAELIGAHPEVPRKVEARLAELRRSTLAELTRRGLPVPQVEGGYLIPIHTGPLTLLRDNSIITIPLPAFGGQSRQWSIASALPICI